MEKFLKGAATGRPRRVGPFNVVASRYDIRCQGTTEIALTKMDVLSAYEEIEICEAYELGGKIIHEFPFIDVLDDCNPVFTTVKGWNCDISKCRKKEDLPKEALDYIAYIEKMCDCRVKYVSVVAERGGAGLGVNSIHTQKRHSYRVSFLWCSWPDLNRHGISTEGF